ncbi:cytochrome P450 2U1-like [Haliotis rubra]|uniref:cytochrome P450 2U1-like n=1 Tax=Haliotis rubra TaxID=36100 RepID=UPI001EE4FB80|nr:cytochrome P450 2U1-like [Haliotis rubra]XP_046571276.1 cytochrome P450 2U1-like [Haliotis rubra]XP_046571277.1 cytochrome P450 2U1-like [Haliotis rubra]XP_046571278.1 cytochrome P450 2U1-like [Haliotis rubra]XP_046571279.1 cytochrome P450 2U1-like [Haliotis rubra]XP_046571280.1 cytochrome P450 2U1-like [Haliotis rubra]
MELILVGVATCVLAASLKYLFWGKKTNLPPGPSGLPIIGNFHQIDIVRLHHSVEKFRKRFNGIFRLNVFGCNIVVIDSYDLMKEAFASSTLADVFAERPPIFPAQYILPSDIIFQPYTRKVVEFRKILHQVIRAHGSESTSRDTIYGEINHLIERLQAHGTDSFDPKQDIYIYVANTLLTLLTGRRREGNDELMKVVSSIEHDLSFLANPGNSLLMALFPFMRYLPSKTGRSYRNFMGKMDEVVGMFIKEYSNGDIDSESTAGQLLGGNVEVEGKKLTEDDIRGLVMDLLGAAAETTRQTMLSALLYIANHRKVQEKIQAELSKVVPHGAMVTGDDKARLPYTNAALLEFYRVHSPLPLPFPHATSRDVDFQGYHIPENTTVLFSMWSIHHDENFWERPFEYIPERFLDQNGDLLPSSHEKRRRLVAFSLGKRICPGEGFARLRVFLCVANILQNFDILADKSCPLPPADSRTFQQGVVLYPPSYKIRLRKRESK